MTRKYDMMTSGLRTQIKLENFDPIPKERRLRWFGHVLWTTADYQDTLYSLLRETAFNKEKARKSEIESY